ncbi:RimJ/RimL family protein N-acetyltransferase [Melghiribacillus thermohalophilus]|uniref:RimJ/RimL family protein N-acetyltransferase n=1 Tax=Melghiribacillus thermohalophilus TaxID=1324956 RepID=A0A4R3NBS9_9BACI|nr:GNAT family N-acetyltransferase [Melghiribacillus thermohalophilus]TCT26904.1 RimJ/RimL family protein N-acetyltransferase [Melghiribacillus thermohalophilus]
MQIMTKRLTLIPISKADAYNLIHHPPVFFKRYQAPIHHSWPHDGLKSLLPLYAEDLQSDPDRIGFGPWVIFNENRCVIGDIGLKGKPDKDGGVEVGYFVNEEKRNRGYASEALKAICEWAFSQNKVNMMKAVTDQNNLPSQKVLEKNGFEMVQKDDPFYMYEKYKGNLC